MKFVYNCIDWGSALISLSQEAWGFFFQKEELHQLLSNSEACPAGSRSIVTEFTAVRSSLSSRQKRNHTGGQNFLSETVLWKTHVLGKGGGTGRDRWEVFISEMPRDTFINICDGQRCILASNSSFYNSPHSFLSYFEVNGWIRTQEFIQLSSIWQNRKDSTKKHCVVEVDTIFLSCFMWKESYLFVATIAQSQ